MRRMRTGADQEDGTHVGLPVADALAVSSDHARVPVMMLRHFMEHAPRRLRACDHAVRSPRR
jgi:hypothetical protein